MAKVVVFSFDDMGKKKDAATKAVARYFARAGEHVVQIDVPSAVRRTAGISYREMRLTFADSQTVSFFVKQSGDIYQVKLNGRLFSIKHQDDQPKAIAEIVKAMDSGRSKFQAAMAKVKVALPASIRTAAPKMEAILKERIANLDEALSVANSELAALG